jgi:hypothetical protein
VDSTNRFGYIGAMLKHLTLSLCFLGLVACGPNPKAPAKVQVFIPNVQGKYEPAQVELKTVSNLSALKGSVVEFVGGTRVVFDDSDPIQNIGGGVTNKNDDQRYDILVRDKGLDVHGNFVDKSGVFWPADFHTWNMTTSFYNFERAYDYWLGVYNGEEPKALQKIKVLYWSDVKINSTEPILDNALYLSFVKSFVITPFKVDQLIPFGMNVGIVGHEMAHRVFNEKAAGGQGIPAPLLSWANSPTAFNLYKSLDEGLADYHGFGLTCLEAAGCRPGFLAPSISDETTVKNRDMSRADQCLTDPVRNAYKKNPPAEWVRSPDLYRLGSLWASALWHAGEQTGKRQILQRALLEAYDDESTSKPGLKQFINGNINTPENFTMELVANTIVAHIGDPELKKVTCNELTTRLQLKCAAFGAGVCPEMPDCPATSARQTFCPVLMP